MSSKKTRFPFNLTVQTVLNSRELIDEFEDQIALLGNLGFYGIELNLPDLWIISPKELKNMLDRHGLVLTYIATGAFAKKNAFSLSTSDDKLRDLSVNGVLENAEYAKGLNAGIILGYFKGQPEPDSPDPSSYLKASIREICHRKPADVPVLVEATNSSECCVINRISDALEIVDVIKDPSLYVLPDTYHMAIMEKDMINAVTMNLQRICNIHLSDNNRFFPGFGTLDFKEFLSSLFNCGYKGTLGIEGKIMTSFSEDIQASADYLNCLF